MTDLRARPTVYSGIRMRSRLEARVAAMLDREGFRWSYEPQAYASAGGQYLPDFVIGDVSIHGMGAPSPLHLEVKGPPLASAGPLNESDRALMQRMEIALASEPQVHLALTCEGWLEDGRLMVRPWEANEWYATVLLRCPFGCGSPILTPFSKSARGYITYCRSCERPSFRRFHETERVALGAP